MAAEPLYLTVLHQGDTIVADLAAVDPLVPRGQIQVADGLLLEINAELARITALANKQVALHAAGGLDTDANGHPYQAVQRLGRLIFSHLFPAAVRQRLAAASPTELFLRLDDQLVHIPWELAFDGQEFLLNKFRIGRQVITQHQRPVTSHPRELTPPGPLKMLIISDPTESLPAAAEEAEQLCDLLDTYERLEVAVMGGKDLRKLDLLQALNEYDLVHYAGHAFFDPARPHHSGWLLHEAVLTASELSLVPQPPLLVFANACQAGATTRWQAETVYEGQAFGIGSAFLLAGTQNYIGTFCVIHDTQSAVFAANFYQHLLHGQPLGLALTAARRQAFQDSASSGLLWASYMHYGNPALRLSMVLPEPAVEAIPPLAPSPILAPVGGAAPRILPESPARADTQPAPGPAEPGSATRGKPPATTGASDPQPQRPWWKRPRLLGGTAAGALGVFLATLVAFWFWGVEHSEPGAHPLLTPAHRALEQGDWQQAAMLYQQLTAVPQQRLRAQGYAGLAAIAFHQREDRQALDLAGQAEALEPELASTHVLRGHIWMRQGKLEAAVTAYRTATDKLLATPEQRAVAHNYLGQFAAAQGDVRTALGHYDTAMSQRRDMAATYVNKGYLLDKLGQRRDALELYRQALQLNPQDTHTVLLLREAERQSQLARDTEQQQRLDALVARLAQLYRAEQAPESMPTERDDWTSAPLTVAFLPLQPRGTLALRAGDTEAVLLTLIQAFKASGRMTVVEREVLDKLLAEVELSATRLVDPQVALRLGRVLAARLMLIGSLTQQGEAGRLSLRLVATESTDIVTAVTEAYDTPPALDSLVQRLATTLLDAAHAAYPLQGRLVDVTPTGVTVNIGARHGVSTGLLLQVLDQDVPVGLLEVTTVLPQSAQGRVLQQPGPWQPGWKVREVRER
jgi:tetratricopeptide (TPR) repeat protein